jgi:hypothetical protein
MLFKKRVTVPQYCETRLQLIFSPRQDDIWMELKRDTTDAALHRAGDQLFLDNMHAAHLQLMGVAIMKTYMNFEHLYGHVEVWPRVSGKHWCVTFGANQRNLGDFKQVKIVAK